MKSASLTTAIILAAAACVDAGLSVHEHASFPRRHMHNHHKKSNEAPVKRGEGKCKFPTDAGLIAVTPDKKNAGWAMSPDKECKPGNYCPYACPPGQLMAQWDPEATSYTYPLSQHGGLYCNDDGEIEKPFPNKPYCVPGSGTVKSTSSCGNIAFCQTVLPGDEDMLIPTNVDASGATLAVPDPSYWASTAAHYYINPPGVSTKDGCVWGTKEKPHGNWSPYVAGTNQDSKGDTFVTLGWNPIYIEPETPFRTEKPSYGIRIKCDGECTGLPCEINPGKHGVNEIIKDPKSGMKPGAGGAHFCVVNVKSGGKATIEVFDVGSDGGSGNAGSQKEVKKQVASSDDDSAAKSSESISSSSSTTEKPKAAKNEGVNGDAVVASKASGITSPSTTSVIDPETSLPPNFFNPKKLTANSGKQVEEPAANRKDDTTKVEDAASPEPTPSTKVSAGVINRGNVALAGLAAAGAAVLRLIL